MVKFLAGFFTALALVVLTVILLFFAALRLRERPPEVANNSVLVLRLEGEIPEKPPIELPAFLGGGQQSVTVANVWMMLRRAANDAHIRAVVVEPEGLSAGWAKIEEIRGDLEQFRKSGKPVYAYLRTPGAREYYVALGGSRIFLGPEEPVYLQGLRAEVMYFKKTLDKLGVSVDVEHAGKYKDFGDMFTRTDMSPETREVITSLVDDLYGNLTARIAEARKKSPDEVRAILDRGPFTASQALQAGLVDELRFEDQMWGELRHELGAGEPAKIAAADYMRVAPEGSKNQIALLIGEGDIVRGSPSDDGTESSLTSYGFDKLLRQLARDASIKGVVVRIDSPGGEVTASDEIWEAMNSLSKKKPVVISMSDVAASGGYYMALTGDPIVAYPQTETGSIGVVFGKPNLHGLYDKLGVTKDAVQLGRHADINSDYTSLTPDERALLRAGIDESYHDFVAKVAAARHRSYNDIEPSAQGRVWLGAEAKQHGLVDELGGFDTALQAIRKKAGIPANQNVSVSIYPPRQSLLDMITKRPQDNILESKLRQVFGRVPFHAWMRGGFLRMMPYWIEVR